MADMDEADALLMDAYKKVYNGRPQFGEGDALPWGEEPPIGHKVLVTRPDRPEEPFIWEEDRPGGKPPRHRRLRFKKSFVAECLAGKVTCLAVDGAGTQAPGADAESQAFLDDPRAWLMEKMTRKILLDAILR